MVLKINRFKTGVLTTAHYRSKNHSHTQHLKQSSVSIGILPTNHLSKLQRSLSVKLTGDKHMDNLFCRSTGQVAPDRCMENTNL